MNRIEPKRVAVFVGIFCFIAAIESSVWNYLTGRFYGPRDLITTSPPPTENRAREAPSQPTPYEPRPYRPSDQQDSFREQERRAEEASRRAAEERVRIAQQELAIREREQRLATEKAAEEAAERRRLAEEAAAAKARFLALYLNSNTGKQPGMKTVALVAVSEDGKFNRALSAALTEHLKMEGVQILPLVFKPEFISGGFFNTAFTDPNDIFRKLELASFLDAVVLARQKVGYSTSPSLENLITATMELELAAIPTTTSAEPQTWRFSAPGPGFKQSDARAAAEERILKQVAKDTKMSLTTVFSNN